MSPWELERLSEYAALFTGFSREAILPGAISRAALALGPNAIARAAAREPAAVHALCQAVSVGETFFFRQPEHFRAVAEAFAGRPSVRAWSAGCATGEEAFSLAACLLTCAAQVNVLGTDLLDRNLAIARAGVYGAWSQRPSAPLLFPLLEGPLLEGGTRVRQRVRDVVRFAEHNLLERAPGEFELIFCRNVLVYFSPDAARTAVQHLCDALAPGGLIFFGSMDLPAPPAGLAAEGPAELQIFRRILQRGDAKPAPAITPPPIVRPSPEPVAIHLRALVHIERGEKQVAERELGELLARAPDYVPGILERALLFVRTGERAAALPLMREVLRRTDALPADDLLPGPEPLPVRFYRESAQTYLKASAP